MARADDEDPKTNSPEDDDPHIRGIIHHVDRDWSPRRGHAAVLVGACMLYEEGPTVLLSLTQERGLTEIALRPREAKLLATRLLEAVSSVDRRAEARQEEDGRHVPG